MKNPKISVIIPTYNRENYITNAISSVLNQSFQDFELLIIDDASTDNTKKIIEDLNNDKIKYYRLEKNGGQCVARNFGIKKALGEYVAFLDSDDEWLPDKLKKQLAIMESNNDKLGAIYGIAYRKSEIDEKQTLIDVPNYRGNIYKELLKGFCPPTPSIFFVKRNVFEECGMFDENLITFVDLDMWLRIGQKYEFDYVDEPIIIKYEHSGFTYVNNITKRLEGLQLFANKWKKEIISTFNVKEYKKLIKKKTESSVYLALENPNEKAEKNIPFMMKNMISVKSTRIKIYMKIIFLWLFGVEKYKKRLIRNRNSNE